MPSVRAPSGRPARRSAKVLSSNNLLARLTDACRGQVSNPRSRPPRGSRSSGTRLAYPHRRLLADQTTCARCDQLRGPCTIQARCSTFRLCCPSRQRLKYSIAHRERFDAGSPVVRCPRCSSTGARWCAATSFAHTSTSSKEWVDRRLDAAPRGGDLTSCVPLTAPRQRMCASE